MESLRRPLAAILCLLLCSPASLGYTQQVPSPTEPAAAHKKARPAYSSKQLRGDQRILQALNRFTFGPRPGDVEAVRAEGLEKWFEAQLHPESMDETDLNARLADFPEMQWSTEDLLYRLPSNAEIRQAMTTGRVPIPTDGTLHAIYENQIYRLEAKKAEKAAGGAENGAKANDVQGKEAAGKDAGGTMQLASDGSMVRVDAQGNVVTGTGAADSANAMGADSSPTAMSTAGSMETSAGQTAGAQTAFDATAIAAVLALGPEQRVERLAAMQPEEFEGFIKSLRPVERVQLNVGLSPGLRLTVRALENPERLVAEDLIAERLTRDIYSNAQLDEVMTDFWLNHFNVYLRKNEQMPYYLVSYARDTIRPRALGKFEDLLDAVAQSPAMLAYLDNAQSVGPHSLAAERAERVAVRRPEAKKKVHEGLNENYARELMELHTLGVNGGYTQADVTEVARVLTGWGIDRPLVAGSFNFNPNRHEPGTKKVLGKKIKENGEMEGRELLHMLASSPATARFICGELAVRFVADDPPPELVDRMAKSYMSSGGDIAAVLRTLFRSPEFWSEANYRAKVKTPLEFVVSAVRASNASVRNVLPLANQLRQMGMPVYGSVPPTGYDWKASTWVSTGALVDRMNFALALAANRLPGVVATWAEVPDLAGAPADTSATPESEEARLEAVLIPGGVSETTRSAALQQFAAQTRQDAGLAQPVAARRRNRAGNATAVERQDQVLAGLLIGSPEFQRR
ncbi:MAG TPA: DUF1800 domain-containing protein [Terracidiphilus sp.]|nr:DUF1800 domain-containing protein [Terracidiphilus sp.]